MAAVNSQAVKKLEAKKAELIKELKDEKELNSDQRNQIDRLQKREAALEY